MGEKQAVDEEKDFLAKKEGDFRCEAKDEEVILWGQNPLLVSDAVRREDWGHQGRKKCVLGPAIASQPTSPVPPGLTGASPQAPGLPRLCFHSIRGLPWFLPTWKACLLLILHDSPCRGQIYTSKLALCFYPSQLVKARGWVEGFEARLLHEMEVLGT